MYSSVSPGRNDWLDDSACSAFSAFEFETQRPPNAEKLKRQIRWWTMLNASLQRTFSIAVKELLHILRDPTTLFFTLFLPVMELFMLGYAIDTNVRNVRTVIFDEAGTQESRAFIRRFENTTDFKIVAQVYSEVEMSREIVAGRARIGIKIPHDYSRKLEAGETAQVLVLVDGTESSIAAEAVNVGNAIALQESLARVLNGKPLPVESRPRVLFNPDTRSANFFIPGLMVILCQMMGTMLSANAIVPIIWQRMTIRPGMKKLAERVSGLKRTRGRDSTGSGLPLSTRASDSCRAMALPTLTASAAMLDSVPSTRTRTWAVSPASSLRE